MIREITRLCLLTALLAGNGSGFARQMQHQPINTKNKEDHMTTTERNKEQINALYHDVLNAHQLALLPGFIAEDFSGAGGKKGAAAFAEPINMVLQALPNAQWKLQSIIAENDQIAVRWVLQGTHTGQFQHIAATGRTVSNPGMAIYQLKNGKITSVEVLTDRLGFLQALDAVPKAATATVNAASRNGRVSFIDKFLVPPAAQQAFHERMRINRSFIKQLPGFMGDEAYEYADDNGNLVCVTVAQWASKEAFTKAREAVQEAYVKEGFNPVTFFQQLHITADRGVYTPVE